MANRYFLLFLSALLLIALPGFAQESTQELTVDSIYNEATDLVEQSQLDRALQVIDVAIDFAAQNGLEYHHIKCSIQKGEILRSLYYYDLALDVLYNIENDEKYPQLQAYKLGRIAGTIGGITSAKFDSRQVKYDSMRTFLEQGIAICEQHDFIKEEANLKNELGLLSLYSTDGAEGRSLLREAAALYKQAKDSLGYVRAVINSYSNNYDVSRTTQDSLIRTLNRYVEGKACYALKVDLYGMYAYFSRTRGDSIDYLKWIVANKKEIINLEHAQNTKRLSDLRISYQTEKIKEEVIQKAEALKAAEKRSAELIIYVSILGVLVFGILTLLFRQRTLNKKVKTVNLKLNALNGDLNLANEKYHMLIVESNHRIKNNLQMIISMLQYTSKDLGPDNQLAIDSLTSKIHTISALHKHLYADVHNERVKLGTYFKEIVSLYVEISSANFSFNDQIDKVEIRSERIIYFGLIFNELLSNSIEHNKVDVPQISLRIYKQDSNYLFAYEDGEKRPENEKAGMGTQLIAQLIRRIGGQNYELNPHNGRYQFEFEVDQ